MDSENLNLYFREIIFQDPKAKKDSVCGVFSYEAMNIEDARLGNLYLIGKISNVPKNKYKNSDFLLNLLASAIKREFYSNHQRTSMEALESALQSANIYLSDFVKKGHNEWIGNLHFVCLCFYGNNIHVAQTGNMVVQLFRNGTLSNISKKFQNQEKPEPIKTFSNLASGKIEHGDKIIAATYDISDILSLQKTKELISYQTTDKLYHYIKDNLSVPSLACLILEAGIQSPQEPEKKEVFETEKVAIEITFNFKKILDSNIEKINRLIKNQITFPNKITIFALKHHIVKYLAVLFLLFTIILSPFLIEKISSDIKIRKMNHLLQRAQENVERSELSLIYQNQSEARAFLKQSELLLENADLLFNSLPEKAQEKVLPDLQSIQNWFEKQKNSLNNVVNIIEIERIADLSKNNYNFNPLGILKLENLLYLYELTSGFVYKIDLIDNSSELVFLSSKDTFKLGAATDTEILLLANPTRISTYNINENYNICLLKPNLENTLNIKDMASYDGNLFFLDVQKLNIFKYSRTQDILNGAEWIIKGPTDELKDAVSLAVDGDVFASKENGIIIHYSQGKKIKEIKLDISPRLSQAGQIFTSANMKNLYILDPSNSRIISYNKKDGLIKQYAIPELSNLKDLWVTSDEKSIYLLNGLEICKIEI
jgi:hypothetical protein